MMGEQTKTKDTLLGFTINDEEKAERSINSGRTTEFFEATGQSGIADALHGAKQDDDSVVEGFSGDAFMGNLADGVATSLSLQFGNPFLQSLAHTSTTYLMLEVSQIMFDGIGGFTAGNTLGFSIAQLKDMVKDVLQKLDTILDEPSKSCGDFIDKALQAIEDGYHTEAKRLFENAVNKSVQGFNYATSSGKLEMMIFIIRLMIIAEVSLTTFNEEKKEFVSGLNNLSVKQQKRMYSVISKNMDKLIEAVENLAKKEWFTRDKTFREKNQNALDVLLRQMLPLLVQLNPFQFQQDNTIHREELGLPLVINHRHVPDGLEDAALIGKKDSTVALWKDKNKLMILLHSELFEYPINENKKEVVIVVDTVKKQVMVDMDHYPVYMFGHYLQSTSQRQMMFNNVDLIITRMRSTNNELFCYLQKYTLCYT